MCSPKVWQCSTDIFMDGNIFYNILYKMWLLPFQVNLGWHIKYEKENFKAFWSRYLLVKKVSLVCLNVLGWLCIFVGLFEELLFTKRWFSVPSHGIWGWPGDQVQPACCARRNLGYHEKFTNGEGCYALEQASWGNGRVSLRRYLKDMQMWNLGTWFRTWWS